MLKLLKIRSNQTMSGLLVGSLLGLSSPFIHAVERSVGENTPVEYAPGLFAEVSELEDGKGDTETLVRLFEGDRRVRSFLAFEDSEFNRLQRIVKRPGGGFAIVWLNQDDDNFRETKVLFRVYGADGRLTSPGGGTLAEGNLRLREPDIAVLANGNFVIVFEDNVNARIIFQLVNANGARLGDLQIAARDTDALFSSIRLEPLVAGGFAIQFRRDSEDFTVTFDNDGNLLGESSGMLPTVPEPEPEPEPEPPGVSLNQITGTPDSENINGTSGNDRIDGLAGNDRLFGLEGNDVLFGGPGFDYLAGGPGDDILIGSVGYDVLQGGPGNDTLIVGPNNNNPRLFARGMIGDEGRDTFVLSDDFGVVTIQDFEPGIDVITYSSSRPLNDDLLVFSFRGSVGFGRDGNYVILQGIDPRQFSFSFIAPQGNFPLPE